MSRERSSLQRRARGALALGAFGALIAGPMEYFDSGNGRDVVLALLVGATAGVIVGFLFPALLRRRQEQRPTTPPPAPPPPPPGHG